MKKNYLDIIDPIHDFIRVYDYELPIIDNPLFQRLRRVKQLSGAHLTYPSAQHSRFEHSLGVMHIATEAGFALNEKGFLNSDDVQILRLAGLLHDIGHGPFSHALENSIANNISHEDLSKLFMEKLNKEFDGKLSLSIQIFNNKHPKKFLHQLVSSQLDMDRLDYLKRDSFFTGVTEGNIGTERIINMLDVVNDQLVIEEKGIYSIEKFLIARRLMYWQVYLHKTVISVENTLIKILKRAKQLIQNGENIFSSSALKIFLKNNFIVNDFKENDDILESFSKLDDHDIYSCIKEWSHHDDFILSSLSDRILNRDPLKIKTQNKKFLEKEIDKLKQEVAEKYNISIKDTNYLVFTDKVSNNAYHYHKSHINILMKNGEIKHITEASDQFNIDSLSKTVNKYFLCYPKM